MKKVGQLMEEMGFNKEASTGSKEAFLKHLMKAAVGVQVTTPTEKKEIIKNNIPQISVSAEKEIQLQFAFIEDDREVS